MRWGRRRRKDIVLMPETPTRIGQWDTTQDVARCNNKGCGALLPITDRPARCPVCGRA
jgi:hypothetical protein